MTAQALHRFQCAEGARGRDGPGEAVRAFRSSRPMLPRPVETLVADGRPREANLVCEAETVCGCGLHECIPLCTPHGLGNVYGVRFPRARRSGRDVLRIAAKHVDPRPRAPVKDGHLRPIQPDLTGREAHAKHGRQEMFPGGNEGATAGDAKLCAELRAYHVVCERRNADGGHEVLSHKTVHWKVRWPDMHTSVDARVQADALHMAASDEG